MARLLRIANVILLPLSVASLVLGIVLFRQRERLKGRAQKLERALMVLAVLTEDDLPHVNSTPNYPERDVDEATAEETANPRLSNFWPRYAHELEMSAVSTIDLTDRRDQLMRYYSIDPITLKPRRDPGTGERLVDGPGTMQELIDEVAAKSEQQLHRLNRTRTQLRHTREELVTTITDINGRKQELRVALRNVGVRDHTIVQLHAAASDHQEKFEAREQRVIELSDALRDEQRQNMVREETIGDLQGTIKTLEVKIEEILARNGTLPRRTCSLTRGHKGRIAAVSDEWNFVLIELTDKFVKQYINALTDTRTDPHPELTIMRDGTGNQEFVTKVQLDRVHPEQGLGIANILPAQQQAVIRHGDRVVY